LGEIVFATLDDWVACEAIPFSVDSPESVNAAVDTVMASRTRSCGLQTRRSCTHQG